MGEKFIPPHGAYRKLLSYRNAEIVYDPTICFFKRFMDKKDRTYDQMVQAAHSGKKYYRKKYGFRNIKIYRDSIGQCSNSKSGRAFS